MFEDFYFVEQFIIAFVIGFGYFFFLFLIRLLLFDLFRDILCRSKCIFFLHAIRFKYGKFFAIIFVLFCAFFAFKFFHHNLLFMVYKSFLFIIYIICEIKSFEWRWRRIFTFFGCFLVGLFVKCTFSFAVILAHEIGILLFWSFGHKRFISSYGLSFKIFQTRVFLDSFFFLSQNTQVQSLLSQRIEINIIHVSRNSSSIQQIICILLYSCPYERFIQNVNNRRSVLSLFW